MTVKVILLVKFPFLLEQPPWTVGRQLPFFRKQSAQTLLEFDKTIYHPSPADLFQYYKNHNDIGKVTAKEMPLLHYYVSDLIHAVEDPFQSESFDQHLELIQCLIANGADPKAKAIFILPKKENKKIVNYNVKCTAAEYARAIADQIIKRFHSSIIDDVHLIWEYNDENEFLTKINHIDKEKQNILHQKFQQFRNLERVLSGEQALPYTVLPEKAVIPEAQTTELPAAQSTELTIDKTQLTQPVPPAEKPKTESEKGFADPIEFESKLNTARKDRDQVSWKTLKKEMVDHVQQAGTLQDFLVRVELYKKPLQKHYDITYDARNNKIYGSTLYRLFHYFDSYKNPTSWENLRKFGQDKHGIDINSPYDQLASSVMGRI